VRRALHKFDIPLARNPRDRQKRERFRDIKRETKREDIRRDIRSVAEEGWTEDKKGIFRSPQYS